MSYTQLTREQRYQIYALKKAGHLQVEIARVVGVDKSTIRRPFCPYVRAQPVRATKS